MDQSDSTSSASSSGSPRNSSTAPFAYQTRLLERTSSLSRSTSLSKTGIVPNPTGSATPSGTRRWTPSHRFSGSMDTVRGKWEERAKTAESALDGSDLKDGSGASSLLLSSSSDSNFNAQRLDSIDNTPTPPPKDATVTPRFLKRHTLPVHIIASPLSPNTTGVTVADPDSPTSSRIHLPSYPLAPARHYDGFSPSSFVDQRAQPASLQSMLSNKFESPLPLTADSSSFNQDGISSSSAQSPSLVSLSSTPTRARPISLHLSQHLPPQSNDVAAGRLTPSSRASFDSPRPPEKTDSRSLSSGPSFERHTPRPVSSYGPSYARSTSQDKPDSRPSSFSSYSDAPLFSPDTCSRGRNTHIPPPASPSASVMSPTPYRSPYMLGKKASHGSDLVFGRKLGKHLPRIASGDGNEDWNEEKKAEDEETLPLSRREKRERRMRQWNRYEPSPEMAESPVLDVSHADGVVGMAGRIRLSRDNTPASPTSPMPSTRFARGGLWADTQRHLLQAYEYLCHVGEAQQWIEGCLGEELPFGVVEMEQGLRNGVVLAKLVRVFQGESVIRKIYEAPKLDFRHSDNINYFFNFVREVGLPEGFIFELTDLYNQKNLPKVIYCIHALSHLLSRRGMAERIGNLLGRLKFSDDQLQQTQKGLRDAGVAMPNFSNVGRELAKEINEETEETDDERIDRLLLENEASIRFVQSLARGFLARKVQATLHGRMRLAERYFVKMQARCRGALVRSQLTSRRQQQGDMIPWVIAIQSASRGVIARRAWRTRLTRIRASVKNVITIQAQARGVLQRRQLFYLKLALRRSNPSVVKLQSIARARMVKMSRLHVTKTLATIHVTKTVTKLQAHARATMARRMARQRKFALEKVEFSVVGMQAHARGALMRRHMRNHLAKLDDISHVIIRIQAAVRTYLARKRLLHLIRALRRATPVLVGLQARARAILARKQHQSISKALAEVTVVTSVGGFQTLARAALTRNRHREQQKRLQFSQPDVVDVQALARGVLARCDYRTWREHLRRSQMDATYLQALLRGSLQRQRFRSKMQYYRANLDKVVKIQSLFRAKDTREQYRQLTLGKNVTVGTIKNFVHLLDDSQLDFEDEIKIERLRKRVVESIRENQALETDVSELDVKIALVVQNVKSFDELIKARRKHGADTAAAHAARASVLAAHGDPFAGPNTLDHSTKRKRELYQQLFYLLQTRGEYLAKLFFRLSRVEISDKIKRVAERVVLTLFGYGQDRREDYLLLKLFQLSILEEVRAAPSLTDIYHGHPMYINVAVHYSRPKQATYVRDTLQVLIREIIESSDLDLETDPTVIYRSKINIEEMRSGMLSSKRKDLAYNEAVEDPETRVEFIRHLQVLLKLTEAFVNAITESTRKMPYGIRYLARETLAALRIRFPNESEDGCASAVGRLVYYRFINPAILTPESFDIVTSTVGVAARKNLAVISKMLTQIATGSLFGDDDPSFTPLNSYVEKGIQQMSAWFMQVATVADAETQYHAHEFLDATVQPKPIYISPNEVYSMHTLLAQHLDHLVAARDDPLSVILTELDGVPNLGSDELKDARDRAITLELTNRFSHVKDAEADEKALWVQAKRGVLAILRVQPGKDLVESLMQPVHDEHERLWEEIVDKEIVTDHMRLKQQRRMPSTTGADAVYRLEDIQSLSFREVKAHAIFFLLELEKRSKVSRSNGYQDILNAIASDVCSKHRKRILRQQEMESMNEALQHLAERKKYFEEQIGSYHSYVEAAMNTMQRGKGKKRFVMPFTKQYFHLRDVQRSGKAAQFGSFKYSAQDLYDKGILLSIDQFSPRQFDKIDLVISSNSVGVFTIEVYNHTFGATTMIAAQDLRMEDLLQAQFENRVSLSLFDSMAKVNLNLLLYQINKKFYV